MKEKKKESMAAGADRRYAGENIFLRLGRYLWHFKGTAILALLLVVSSNVLALLGPTLSGRAIDAIRYDAVTKTAEVDFETVFFNCALMAVFYLISAGLSYILAILMISYSQKIVRLLRQQTFDRLMELPVEYFDQIQAGDVIVRIQHDIATVGTSLSTHLIQIFSSLITIIGALIAMTSISWKMLLLFLITLPISITATIWRARKVRPLFRTRSKKLGELNGYTEEILTGLKTIKAYGREKQFHRRYAGRNKETVDAFYDADAGAAIMGPLNTLINNLSLIIISVAGACFFLSGAMTMGNISSFILYGRRFTGPINEFANTIGDLQSLRSAAERVFTIIDEYPEKADAPDARSLTELRGDVAFEHVKFRYTPEREIIHDLSFSVPAGKTVAIVGPTGGGKTTIVNLLMRFYDIQHGEILLDGRSIYSIPRRDLRSAFTMVLQETWLFHGTVAENIAYGAPSATREEIEAAAKAAGIHRFILTLPQGYDTILEDGGLNVSKGQKQLLTIARSMLSHAKMLILDEATSNVDTRTELKIEKAMLKLMKGKTCFVIAHRLSTVQHADLILVVRDGDVVETGTHRELLDKNGFYAELYRSQYT